MRVSLAIRIVFACTAIGIFCVPLNPQTGGTFDLSHNLISGGGGQSNSAGMFAVVGSIGQNIVGTKSSGGGFGVHGGFWQPEFSPTAALVSVGGRVLRSDGLPVGQVRIVLTGAGDTRTAISNAFGYYRFDNVTAGEIYIVEASSRTLQFPVLVISVFDEMNDVDIVALQ